MDASNEQSEGLRRGERIRLVVTRAACAALAGLWLVALPAPGLAADELACLVKESKSFPVRLVPTGERKIKERRYLKQTRKRIRREKKQAKKLTRKAIKLEKRLDEASPKKREQIAADLTRVEDRAATARRKTEELRAVFALFAECRDGEGSLLFPQVIVAESFRVEVGEVLRAAKDVTIRTRGTIEILGRVEADPGSSASITLHSSESDVRIGASAKLLAGDGEPGEDLIVDLFAPRGLMKDTAGQDGGSVRLVAPAGSIAIGIGATIHVGNGGHGGELATSEPEVLAGRRGSVTPKNRGGDSGLLVLDSPSVLGLFASTGTVRVLDSDGLEQKVSAWRLGDDPQVEGGRGGDAGELVFPAMAPAAGALAGLSVTGAAGGDGFRVPGRGQAVSLRAATDVGDTGAGQNVRAIGGPGGACLGAEAGEIRRTVWSACEGGRGGDVEVVGGRGRDGLAPAEEGAAGGEAIAVAGRGGDGIEIGAPQGPCGDATAVGGRGGDGHGSCDEAVRNTGPAGGNGGAAEAYAWVIEAACDPNRPGTATATGGRGGDAGDGEKQSGPGGEGGGASADGDGGSIQTQGAEGGAGGVCSRVIGNDTPVPCANFPRGRNYLPVDATNKPDRDNNACVGGVSDFGAITDPGGARRLSGFVGTELNAPSFPLADGEATSSEPSTTFIQLTGKGDVCTCQINSCRWAELSSRDTGDSLFCAEDEFCLSQAFDLDCTCESGSAIPGCSQKFVSTTVDVIEPR